jgi:hypothetical protein
MRGALPRAGAAEVCAHRGILTKDLSTAAPATPAAPLAPLVSLALLAPQTTDTPVLDLLANMTADSVAASTLEPETLMLVRIAALAAVDAPPVSYLLNLAAARDVGLDADQVRGVLAGIAPIVGTARVASATAKIVDALDIAIEVADQDAQGGK